MLLSTHSLPFFNYLSFHLHEKIRALTHKSLRYLTVSFWELHFASTSATQSWVKAQLIGALPSPLTSQNSMLPNPTFLPVPSLSLTLLDGFSWLPCVSFLLAVWAPLMNSSSAVSYHCLDCFSSSCSPALQACFSVGSQPWVTIIILFLYI